MHFVSLTPLDLALAAVLIVILAGLSWAARLAVERELLVAGARTVIQLSLIGLVLKAVFAHVHLLWISLMAAAMVLAAGREAMMRQERRFQGWWGYGLGTLSMFVSSFALTVLALLTVIRTHPWYQPQYAIPLLGMILGNTMTGIALGLDRLTQTAWDQRRMLEQRLMLGETAMEAVARIRRHAGRSGMIPIINAMAAAGIVSLPGMMTGQILAGAPPMEAVKYQILIMFLIAGGTALGVLGAVLAGSHRLSDARHRLRLDRLSSPAGQ